MRKITFLKVTTQLYLNVLTLIVSAYDIDEYRREKTSQGTVHTHTKPLYGPFSGTTWVSRCQKRTSGLYGARED